MKCSILLLFIQLKWKVNVHFKTAWAVLRLVGRTSINLCVQTCRNSPLNLAGMAVERYIAVCRPLRHSQLCTVQRAYALIALIWAVSFIPSISDVIILLVIQPLSVFTKNVICFPSSVYNTPYHETQSLVVQVTCSFSKLMAQFKWLVDQMNLNSPPQVLLFSFVFLTLIITYLKVLCAARAVSSSNQASAKNAHKTILLHGVQLLICMLSYISPFINLILVTAWPHKRTIILFITFLFTNLLPRLLSPLIYGIRDQKLSSHFRVHFGCKGFKSRGKSRKRTVSEKHWL